MPEIVEVRIMSEFINQNSKDRVFSKLYHVEKGNVSVDSNLIEDFKVKTDSSGKEMQLRAYNDEKDLDFSVFMGMSGNWKFVPTKEWVDTKFVRMRLDTTDGYSLLLHGGYMGPKYKLGKFGGVKRGPDPTKQFDEFKKKILNNLDNRVFNKPICEVLLNQEYFSGVGAYLTAEIVGRLDIDPFRNLNSLSKPELNSLFNMIVRCCEESYDYGGGQIKDWENPFGGSRIKEWLSFYGNKNVCYKQIFGKRNIWIQKKFKTC